MTDVKFPKEVVDLGKAFTVFLPKSLVLPDGSTQSITWQDDDEDTASIPKPFGTFSVKNQGLPLFSDKNAGVREVQESAQDIIVFNTGTTEYPVTEQDIQSVTQITGTFGGSGHTFVEGIDYQVIAVGSFYDNTIEWLVGGDEPDNGTSFTVDYEHNRYQQQIVNRWQRSVVFTLHVSDTHAEYKPKTVFADMLMQSFTSELYKMRGKRVTDGVRLGPIEVYLPTTFDGGEQTARVSVQVSFTHHQLAVLDEVNRMGSTAYTFDDDL